MSKTAKDEIREELLKDAAKELRDRGLTPEIAKEVLKLIEDSNLDDKDNVHVRVVTIKSANKKDAEAPQKEVTEEPIKESEDKPESEEKIGDAGDLILANIRFAKAVETLSNEYLRLSKLAAGFLNENQELRARLGEK